MRLAIAIMLAASPVLADGARPITEKSEFLEIVQGRDLTRLGISLSVTGDGRITGRAMGRAVTGTWDWRDGYFCRDMAWGSTALGPNCQEVAVSGSVVRFTSDMGRGQFADLRLD